MSDTEAPPLHIPKKRTRQDVEDLNDEKKKIEQEVKTTRRRLKAHGSFNAQFWSTAHEVETLVLKRTKIERKISLADFGGHPARWQQTDEARNLLSRVRAQEHRAASFEKQAKALGDRRRKFHEVFMSLFNTSTMGLNIKSGSAPRDKSVQSQFRNNLITDQNSIHPNGRLLWCPIMHQWFPQELMKAGHLFPCMHGQSTMDAIFGATNTPELFSTKNGLLMCSIVEDNFDKGVVAVVPDLPERPSMEMLTSWVKSPVREFKVRILDMSWERIDDPIISGPLTWRQLDGQKLSFRSQHRPAARYLYFHYCVQVLRRAWKAGAGQRAVFGLYDEHGKPYWGTPGRYMARRMLRAFVEELGHQYKPLLEGGDSMGTVSGDRNLLLNTATAQIASSHSSNADDEESDENDDSDEDDWNWDGIN